MNRSPPPDRTAKHIYAVGAFTDVIKVKTERETVMGYSRYQYFDTEEAAKQFILDRAAREYQEAAAAFAKARDRLSKVRRKFGPKN